MFVAHIKAGKERAFARRHPWVYSGAIAKLVGRSDPPTPGETIKMLDSKGQFLAWGAYNEGSQLRIRVWSFLESEVIDPHFIARRVAQACARRESLKSRTNAIRLIFGEADGLPGLVVDRYGDQLVMQCMSAGADYWREAAADALLQTTGCTDIYERSDAAARQREGLPTREGVLRGKEPPLSVMIQEDGISYGVDVRQGHKTGFYIDQRDSRHLVSQLVIELKKTHSKHLSVLNCFCYTGGFSIAALRSGADEVVSVDSSGDALAQGQKNWAMNQNIVSTRTQNESQNSTSIAGRVTSQASQQWLDTNVFDYLKLALKEEKRFDVIILDPPKFAPSAHHLDKASRAYKELNLKALQLLKPNGLLLTFSCSGAVSLDLFQKIVAGAIFDAHVDAQLLKRLAAGEDHPMAMTHPEGEYLKGLLLRRI